MLDVVDLSRLARAIFIPLPLDPEEYDGLKVLRLLWNNRDENVTLAEIGNQFGIKEKLTECFQEMLVKFSSIGVLETFKEGEVEKYNLTKDFRDRVTEEQRLYNSHSFLRK
jgi:hypothetical protein